MTSHKEGWVLDINMWFSVNKTFNQHSGAIKKHIFLLNFASIFLLFCLFFSFFEQKNIEKHITTSIWSVPHPCWSKYTTALQSSPSYGPENRCHNIWKKCTLTVSGCHPFPRETFHLLTAGASASSVRPAYEQENGETTFEFLSPKLNGMLCHWFDS